MATSKRYSKKKISSSRKGKRNVSKGRKSRKGRRRFTRKTIGGGGGIELWKYDTNNNNIMKIDKSELISFINLHDVIVFQGDKPVYKISVMNSYNTPSEKLSFDKYLQNTTPEINIKGSNIIIKNLEEFKKVKPGKLYDVPEAEKIEITYDRFNTENKIMLKSDSKGKFLPLDEYEQENSSLNIRWISLDPNEIDNIVKLKNQSKSMASKAFSFVKKTIISNKINVMDDLRYAREFIYLNSINNKRLQQENLENKYITNKQFYRVVSDNFNYYTVEDQNREMSRYSDGETEIGPEFNLFFNCLKIEVKESTDKGIFLRYVREQKKPTIDSVVFPLKPEVFKTRVLNYYRSLI
jgi:hypothetical protein